MKELQGGPGAARMPELHKQRLPQGEKESYIDKNVFRLYGGEQVDARERPRPQVLEPLPFSSQSEIANNRQAPFNALAPRNTREGAARAGLPNQREQNEALYNFRGRSDVLADDVQPGVRHADLRHSAARRVFEAIHQDDVDDQLDQIHDAYRYPRHRANWQERQGKLEQERLQRQQEEREYARQLEQRLGVLMEEARRKYMRKQLELQQVKQDGRRHGGLGGSG